MDVLLIEDNESDRETIQMAFREVCPEMELGFAENGEKALPYFSASELPRLILLDLNLPGKSGRDILSEIKSDERLRHIPVLILTTSQNQKDICETYSLHANCFLSKPFGYQPLLEMVREVCAFWLKRAKLCQR